MTCDVEDLFLGLFASAHVFFGELSFQILSPCFDGVIHFLIVEF